MGYLRLESGDVVPTKKITISLWFRIPAATIAEVHAAHQVLQDAYDNDTTGTVRAPPADSGMIPLVTLGKRNVEKHGYDSWNYPTGPVPWNYIQVVGSNCSYPVSHWDCGGCTSWVQGPGAPGCNNLVQTRSDDPTFVGDYADKSFIGVNCRGGTPVFDFRLQYDWDDGSPTVAGFPQLENYSQSPDPTPQYFWFSTSPLCTSAPFCGPPGLGTLIIGGVTWYWEGHQFDFMVTQEFSERDYSNVAALPEAFCGFPDGSDDGGQSVSGDRWHHVLFSIDMDHEVNTAGTQRLGGLFGAGSFTGEVNSAARCMLAFDDVDKTGTKLSRATHATPFGAGVQPLGDGLNDLVTDQAWRTFQSFTDTNYTTDNDVPGSGGGVRNDTYTGRNRPSYSFTPPNFSLTPIAIPGDSDTVKLIELAQLQVFTGVVVDTSDVAIRRLFVGADGKPVAMGTANSVLDAVPVVAIKGSANWIAGTNTGTGGALDPSGTITEYAQGPAL